MFAILALLCFLLVVFGTTVGINLIALGLAFVAAHLLFGMWPLFGAASPWQR